MRVVERLGAVQTNAQDKSVLCVSIWAVRLVAESGCITDLSSRPLEDIRILKSKGLEPSEEETA